MGAKHLLLLLGALLIAGQGFSQSKSKFRSKKIQYEEVDFEDMIRRYFGKAPGPANELEGIYSVSCVITKQYKAFLSRREQIRVVERKDNYARVAIVKDWPGSKRDYIEISLSYRDASRYPIVGELNLLSEGRGMIYRHIEPNASTMSFSMTSDPSDLIEGEYSFSEGRKTITYKVSYLKIYPKAGEMIVTAD
jgi:hypothetical protein